MAKLIPAIKRITYDCPRRYRAYDDHEDLGLYFKQLSRKLIYRDKYDEAGTVLIRVAAPRGLSRSDIDNCLNTAYTFDNCTHDFDCCGCWFGWVGSVKKVKPREYLVRQYINRNC